MKRVRVEEAGPYVDVIVYPVSKGRENRSERAAAARCTSDIRQKLNDRTAANKFRRLIAANFAPSDLVVTLTYSEESLPATPDQARVQKLKPFIKKVRTDLREIPVELRYMYVTEGLHGDKRLHHHMIVPNSGDIRETIRRYWKHGYVGFERISSRGYEAWASYLTKEPRKTGRRRVGDRMWTPSLNLNKPIVTVYDVNDDYKYEPPPGVRIKHNEEVRTEWFQCQYISFYRPDYLQEN